MIIGIDPGKTTGVFRYHPSNGVVESFEADQDDLMRYLKSQEIAKRNHDFTFVVESFVITPQTARKSAAPWSLKIIGICEFLCSVTQWDLVMQSPSEKEFSTDDKLRVLGWYEVSRPHQNDAARHVLRYAYKNQRLHEMERSKIERYISSL